MSQNITLLGASYSNVPSVSLPKTGGGTASFVDVTDTTAAASDVASGKYFYTSAGVRTQGTSSGGGGSSVQVGYAIGYADTMNPSVLTIDPLDGEPNSFIVYQTSNVATGTPAKVVAVAFDGTNMNGQTITNTSNAQVSADTGFTKSYSNGTLTLTASTAQFVTQQAYYCCYTYGGGAIDTKDVQVGSGATSITFTGLEDEPLYWSCIFKSNFSTSSGYQRVIFTAEDDDGVKGMSMDSSAKYSTTNYSASYSNGSLTISSSGTNAGGYFHQPGYYQLTYAVDDSAPQYQSKTVTPTTSTQNVYPDSGYDALEEVTVNPIPSSYVQPTTTVGATTYRASTSSQTIQSGTYHSAAATIAAVTATNLEAGNIKSGTTITISNGQSNLWSVTGTYTGGGGGSASVARTTWTNSTNTTTSHQFTGLSGTPKAAFLRCTSSLSRSSSSSNYFIADMVWNGTSCTGNSYRRSNGSYANVTSGYSVTTGSNSITFTSSGTSTTNPGSFYNGTYELTYVY